MHSSNSCYLRVNCIQFTFSVLASKMLSRLVSFELCDRELQIGAQYCLATAAYSILENSPFFLNTHTKKLSYILFFPQNCYILFSIFDYLKICPWISVEKTRINHWNKLYSLSCHLFIYKPTATILLAIAITEEVVLIPPRPIVSVDPIHSHHLTDNHPSVLPSPSKLLRSFSHSHTSKICIHISSNSFLNDSMYSRQSTL